MDARQLTVVGFAVAFVAGAVAMHAGLGTGQQQDATSNLLDDPLAKFARLMPDVTHPRCINCHGVVDPFSGRNHPAENMMHDFPDEARRVLNNLGDHDFRNPALAVTLNGEENPNRADNRCIDCHNGATFWFLAPQGLSFVGKTRHEICSMWGERFQFKAEDLRKHLRTDPLAEIAFQGTKGILIEPPDPTKADPPPIGKDEFLALADDWLKGGDGIPCEGWEGTITQTERVNLTTNYIRGAGGLAGQTTEVQNATRTIEITVGGTATFRIAVQGTHRTDTTVVIDQGSARCTTLARSAEVYGTDNGVTSGDAQTATLQFSSGGRYALRLEGPDERTTRVQRMSPPHCSPVPLPDLSETLNFEHPGWALAIDGVLADPSDRTQLKGSKTETVLNDSDAWLTSIDNAVSPLQTRNNGDLLPVPVEVTTTWDLRRRRDD
jgi:hypothetical protein